MNTLWNIRPFLATTSRVAAKRALQATFATFALGAALCPSAQAQNRTWEKPFGPNSIWNTRIGSGAQFSSNQIFPNTEFGTYEDPTALIRAQSSDPVVDMRVASNLGGDPLDTDFNFPSNVYIDGPSLNNGNAVILEPDGQTLRQYNYFLRWDASFAAAEAREFGDARVRLDSDGAETRVGPHGGSGMSALGGLIRTGELTGTGEIDHALRIEIPSRLYAYYNRTGTQQGPVAPNTAFRWPAFKGDGYANQQPLNDPGNGGYSGTDPQLTSGSLLAIPPDVQESSLNLRTNPGRKMFRALKNYGAYLVDDSDAYVVQFCTQRGDDIVDGDKRATGLGKGVKQELAEVGLRWPKQGDLGDNSASPFSEDVRKIVFRLRVVTNNGPNSVGGGGGAPSTGIDTAQTYKLRLKHATGARFLTQADNAGGNDTPASVWGDAGVAWQNWRFEAVGDGSYRIKNVHSGKVLTQADNNGGNDTPASLWDNYDLDWQRWFADQQSDGSFRLRNKYSNKVLTKADNNGGDNSAASLWDDYNLDWQRWFLDPLSSSPDPTNLTAN